MPAAKATTVEEYIANASEHTRPILVLLRKTFRKASPKLIEAIKWGVPVFEYKGPVVGIAAYKHHVTWGFWKASLLYDPQKLIGDGIRKGGKIAKVSEFPSAAAFTKLILQAIELNEAGMKVLTADPKLPTDLAAALKKNAIAREQFADFTPARKWQYVNWINRAKRDKTRSSRIEAAVARMSEGRPMK